MLSTKEVIFQIVLFPSSVTLVNLFTSLSFGFVIVNDPYIMGLL